MGDSKYAKELRMGLVLYGGVSLAVYIYGVVYEFLRLARQQGAYARLIEAAQVKPVIDIISGSSAGGINGLILAKALATGGSLDPLKDLWIRAGDLKGLIDDEAESPLSLLKSDYYQQLLRQALSRIDAEASDETRTTSLLDLFITATDLDGIVKGGAAQTKQYGTVFHFKVRPSRYMTSEGLEPTYQRRLQVGRTETNHFIAAGEVSQDKNYYLAKVAAATSAFPIAFAPVRFEAAELQQMRRIFGDDVFHTEPDRSAIYADGGMVNNKPFDYTIRTIFNRHAYGPVDRKIFFVEPDPEMSEKTNRLGDNPRADGIHSLLGYFEASLYESITDDLIALLERNNRIQEVGAMLDIFEEELGAFLEDVNRQPGDMRDHYARSAIYPAYRQFKISRLKKDLAEKLLNLVPPGTDKEQMARQIDRLLQAAVGESKEEHSQFLQDFDYPFRIRRLRYFIDKANDWLSELDPFHPQNPDKLALRNLAGRFKANLYDFVELYNHEAWLIWDQCDPVTEATLPAVFRLVREKHRALMNQEDKNETLQMVVTELKPVITKLDQVRDAYGDEYPSLQQPASYVERMLRARLKTNFDQQVTRIFNAYEFLDMHLYPATLLANLGEADPIEVIRISPKDAIYFKTDSVAAKLTGEKLMHFSAFLKQSWRENDIIWGRLDAAEIIVRTLVADEETGNAILQELVPTIIREEMADIRRRREQDISQLIFTAQEQNRVKQILSEHIPTESFQEIERYFIEEYKVGREELADISQTYILETIAKTFRTGDRLFRQRIKKPRTGGGFKPLQILSLLLNLPYFVLILLGGAEETRRKRFISYAAALIAFLLILQIVGVVNMVTWFLLVVIGLVLFYLWPQRLVRVAIVAVGLLLLLYLLGVIKVTVALPPGLFR